MTTENISSTSKLVLGDEHQMLKTSAREFLKANAPVSELRRLRDTGDSTGYDRQLWTEMVAMGWSSLTIPESFGGLDFGYVGLGQVLEEMGRTLTASPMVATVLNGVSALILAGSEKQKAALLPAIANGQITLAFAHDEGRHHRSAPINTLAIPANGGYVLNGSKSFVPDGHVADKIIVSARLENDAAGEVLLVMFDRETEGLTIETSRSMDSSITSRIKLDNVTVSPDNILGQNHSGSDVLERVLDISRIGLSAQMLGIMQETFDRTMAYIRERKQFGVVIGSFQGLQHRSAHMYCEIELCKTLVLQGLKAIDHGKDLAILSSTIKAKVGEVLQLVTNEAIQMYGGIGVTDDEDIGLFMKRARVAQQTFGDYNYHLRRYAELNGF